MVLLATSDLHGNLPEIKKEFDILFLCGDICPATNHSFSYQKSWIENIFRDWVMNLPFRDSNSRVVMVWGNHDFVGEHCPYPDNFNVSEDLKNRLVILNNEEVDIQGLKIFGSPYCSIFGHWAFMKPDEYLNEKFSSIPEGLDVLICHDSPTTNKLGAITQGRYLNDNTGNRILSMHIGRAVPKIFLSGHFHSGNHIPECIEGTWMANVSYVDEAYDPVNRVLCIDYNKGVELSNSNFTFLS